MSAPKAGSDRIYRCKPCRRLDVRALWRCSDCGRELCEHGMKQLRVNGGGWCRACAWRRARRFGEHPEGEEVNR